jgi:hypothetical protein
VRKKLLTIFGLILSGLTRPPGSCGLFFFGLFFQGYLSPLVADNIIAYIVQKINSHDILNAQNNLYYRLVSMRSSAHRLKLSETLMDDLTHLFGGGVTGLGVGLMLVKKVIAQYEERLDAVEKRVEEKFDKLLAAVLDIRVAIASASHLHADVAKLASRVDDLHERVTR